MTAHAANPAPSALAQDAAFHEPAPVAPAGLSAPANETILVDSRVVSCDGGDAPLGHPRVWLRIAGQRVMCPYCSRLYVLAADIPASGSAH